MTRSHPRCLLPVTGLALLSLTVAACGGAGGGLSLIHI